MILQERSLRHESRIHRNDLDWLLERINLFLSISIRYGNSNQPNAELVAKGSFTRAKWNSLSFLYCFVSFHDLHHRSDLASESKLSSEISGTVSKRRIYPVSSFQKAVKTMRKRRVVHRGMFAVARKEHQVQVKRPHLQQNLLIQNTKL